jgi:acyl carrier protein
MMQDKVETFVRLRFAGALRSTALTPDTPLFSTGIIDSFGVLELLAFIDDTFGVDIDPGRHELTDFDTINKIVAILRARLDPPAGLGGR